MTKDVCTTHGTLPDTMIMVSNGVPCCRDCKQPLYTQAELDSDSPPQYERDERGDWMIAEPTVEA